MASPTKRRPDRPARSARDQGEAAPEAAGGGAARTMLLAVLGLAAFAATYALARRRAEVPSPAVASPAPAKPAEAAAKPTGAPTGEAPPGMVWIPGGEFTMGSTDPLAWPDEAPAHRVYVDGFWMDEHEVTNAEFREFIRAIGYVTTAEREPDVKEILKQSPPGTPPPPKEMLVPGSLVFTPPDRPIGLDDYGQWWKWTPGASWKHPEGPESDLEGRDDHPVVQVSWDDAAAYAKWAGKRLPTEAEWERAARGGLERMPYSWGSAPPSDEAIFANIWQGHFPDKNTARDGYVRTAPVGSFPPNAYGLRDMAGNVWEWCADWYDRELYRGRAGGEPPRNPRGPARSRDETQPYTPLRVQRGGSFLCNDAYCSRYRPSARHGCSPDTGMSHVGFRCVKSAEPPASEH